MKKVKRNKGGRVLLSARTESNQRCVGGRLRCAPSLRRCAQAACPQTPILRERVTLVGQFVPAGKIKICFRSTLGPLGPNAIKICRSLPSIAHRLVRTYPFGAVVVKLPPVIAQPPRLCQCRRYPYSADTLNFHLVGACVPEARRTQDLVFGAAGRKCLSSRRASHRKTGSGDDSPCQGEMARRARGGRERRL